MLNPQAFKTRGIEHIVKHENLGSDFVLCMAPESRVGFATQNSNPMFPAPNGYFLPETVAVTNSLFTWTKSLRSQLDGSAIESLVRLLPDRVE